MITAERFWIKMDEYMDGRPWKHVASSLGLKYGSIIALRKNGEFPTFYCVASLCDYFHVNIVQVMEIETERNGFLHISFPDERPFLFGKRFWLMVDEYRRQRYVNWTDLSEVAGIPKTTLSSAKKADRTLAVDVTLKMMMSLNMPIQECTDFLCRTSEIGVEMIRAEKTEIEKLRDDITSSVREISDTAKLRDLRRYILFLKTSN